jgi:hypothetical protein
MSTIPTTTTILSPALVAKLTSADVKAIDKLLVERQAIKPEHTGMLSGNTKRINVILGKRTGETIFFTKMRSNAAKLPATAENLAKLVAARDTTPRWEPGKRAALTKQVNAMRTALKA